MEKVLQGKVAIVTGSGQGVGRGIALLLARAGAKVVTNNRKPRTAHSGHTGFRASALGHGGLALTADETTSAVELMGDAESTAADIVAEGGEAVAFYGDVTEYDACGDLIATSLDNFGRVDILVNNAAGLGFGPFAELSQEDWRYQVVPKLEGAFNCMKHAVPHMTRQRYGRILNTASDAWTGIASLSAYSAANSGLVALTKSTAKELSPYGITVNAFCPQAESPGHVNFKATLRTMLGDDGYEAVIDSERMKTSEEAHGPADNMTFLAYLASEEAAKVSGAVFSVTGGGDIALYSEPRHVSHIAKQGSAWTIDELRREVPSVLLKDYSSGAWDREF